MTAIEFEAWKALQLTGLDIYERISPVTAAHVRLGVALGQAIQDGLATSDDYMHFEAWHYAGKCDALKAIPIWQRERF
jgi:hypothetical protein